MWAALSKYGLRHCDLPTMMMNVSSLLRVLALNIDTRYNKRTFILLYIFLSIIAVCYFYVYLVSVVWFVFVRCRETRDVVAAMIVISLGITSEIGTAKLLFMFLHKDTVRQIVDGYLASDVLVERGSRFYKNIMKTLRIVKKRAMLYWIVIIVNGLLYISRPILTPGRHMMEDIFIYYGLEPMLETPNYQIAFLFTIGAVFHTCYTPSNVTAFFIVVNGYTEAQMLALSEELNCLWNDAQEKYKEYNRNENNDIFDSNNIQSDNRKKLNDFIKSKLSEIIKIHVRNLALLHLVEKVSRGIMAAQFFLLIAGVIAELLGGLESTYIEMPFALMQVAMDCFIGQRLMDASLVFQTAVYSCKWENFDKSNMKTVYLMLLISQKDMSLSVGGVTTLSFSCFMSVIRSVYSAYTTLRNTM